MQYFRDSELAILMEKNAGFPSTKFASTSLINSYCCATDDIMDIIRLGLYLPHSFDLIYKLKYAAEGV